MTKRKIIFAPALLLGLSLSFAVMGQNDAGKLPTCRHCHGNNLVDDPIELARAASSRRAAKVSQPEKHGVDRFGQPLCSQLDKLGPRAICDRDRRAKCDSK